MFTNLPHFAHFSGTSHQLRLVRDFGAGEGMSSIIEVHVPLVGGVPNGIVALALVFGIRVLAVDWAPRIEDRFRRIDRCRVDGLHPARAAFFASSLGARLRLIGGGGEVGHGRQSPHVGSRGQ